MRDSTINVDVANDVVTLRGTVASKAESDKAASVAKGIDGVKSVTNQLKVQPGDSMVNTSNVAKPANANANKR
ncbi:MAG: BON domain-containing protein [Pyrinomonadaceae bacterium]|nr:BON domain-containing protein [Pyrinomonadaceae bacterium]